MRENRTYGSEGGEAKSLPYPYRSCCASQFIFNCQTTSLPRVRILAVRLRPSFAFLFRPQTSRGRRENRAPAGTRGLVCKCAKRKRTRAYRCSRDIPAFPARWFTAYFELSPVNGFLATVAPEKFCFSGT